MIDNPLLINALLACILASIAGGIIGSFVVAKRVVFISGGISHSVLGGVGLAIWLRGVWNITWFSPTLGAFLASVIAACIMGLVHLRYRAREDAVIAAIWSFGMALGILFVSKTPGFNVEMMNYLIGNVLWVSRQDLYLLATFDVVILVSVFFLQKRFLAIAFDEEIAKLEGQNVRGLYLLLMLLIAISIVMLVQIMGILLVIMLLTVPAAIANLFTQRFSKMMALAVCLSFAFSVGGFVVAFYFDLPPGATIAMLASFSYLGLYTNHIPRIDF